MPRLHGSVVSFVFDRPDRPVRHEFTPYNIVRGSFQPAWGTYSDNSPDDVQVSYLDEDAGFASRDVRAVLPESEGRKPAQKTYLGIVSRSHAHKIGMAYAALRQCRQRGFDAVDHLGRERCEKFAYRHLPFARHHAIEQRPAIIFVGIHMQRPVAQLCAADQRGIDCG